MKVCNTVDFRSMRFACLRAVRELPRLAPVGSHLSLPPAGVCAPSTTINKVTSLNLSFKNLLIELTEKTLTYLYVIFSCGLEQMAETPAGE